MQMSHSRVRNSRTFEIEAHGCQSWEFEIVKKNSVKDLKYRYTKFKHQSYSDSPDLQT